MVKPFETIPPLPRRLALWGAMFIAGSVILAGCAGFRREQRAQWRNDAETACLKSGKVRESQYVKISKAIDGPGVCGANHPLKVSALASEIAPDVALQNGNLILTSGNLMLTSITPTATLSCPMVSSTEEWLGQDVQAAALIWLGQPVIELITFGSFSCRPMNHRAGAQLSEHSFANAIDAKAFKLADGRVISVAKGWKGSVEEQGFLREVLFGACNRFTTVLGPGSDALHYDHFHMDMARHGAKGERRICKPRVEMPAPPQSQVPHYELQPVAANQPVFKPGPDMQGPGYRQKNQPDQLYAGQSPTGQTMTGQALPPRIDQRPPYSALARAVPPSGTLRPLPLLAPSNEVQQTGNPEAETEDLTDERNFDSKFFDITGSLGNPDDPPRVIQRPAPRKAKPVQRTVKMPFDPAGR